MKTQWTNDRIRSAAWRISDYVLGRRMASYAEANCLCIRIRNEMQAEIDRLTDVGLDAAYGEAIKAGALDDTTRAYHALLDRHQALLAYTRRLHKFITDMAVPGYEIHISGDAAVRIAEDAPPEVKQ